MQISITLVARIYVDVLNVNTKSLQVYNKFYSPGIIL